MPGLPLERPKNPVELAEFRAQETFTASFEITDGEEHMLAELDFAASELGFIGQPYFLQATRGFVIPKAYDSDSSVTYHSLIDVIAEGPFATYSRVSIGRLIGAGPVRAVCLAFDQATLIP